MFRFTAIIASISFLSLADGYWLKSVESEGIGDFSRYICSRISTSLLSPSLILLRPDRESKMIGLPFPSLFEGGLIPGISLIVGLRTPLSDAIRCCIYSRELPFTFIEVDV